MPQNTTAVIIPVYNRATLWRRAVDSVMQQSLLPSNLIIVNDGSTDETSNNIRKWLGDDKNNIINGVNITLLTQEHSNASTARNLGLSEIKDSNKVCDYVLFLDSDDELSPNFIEATTKLVQEQAQVVAVSSPRLTLLDGQDHKKQYHSKPVFDDLQDMAKAPVSWMLYYGSSILSCSLFRISALPKDGFDQSMVIGEDMLFASQVAMQGEWSVVAGAPTKFWRQDPVIDDAVNDATNDAGKDATKDNCINGNAGSLSFIHDPKQSPESAMLAIQARVKTFKLVGSSKIVRRSYLHGILRDFYGLAVTSSRGFNKYVYASLVLYHSIMRWLTWLVRQ
ncbi:MAG: glycosyltransferase family 2 protein [Candidatus Portiera sp.]|nr:glycosyltransferase family 2 protein [Portiera sp.]